VGSKIRTDEDTKDLVFIQILFRRKKNGQPVEATLDFLRYCDEETVFTAMEQRTVWHTSIMTIAATKGEVPKGVKPVGRLMARSTFVEEVAKRGFDIQIQIRSSSGDDQYLLTENQLAFRGHN
jgi:saccharopine dehydrogenase-like NADP-dependent oxidoreductase